MLSVILLMAGKGSRMNISNNKVLLPLKDKLLYEYPLDIFLDMGLEVICVISENDEDFLKNKIKNAKYVIGGKTRQESVLNGLKLCSGEYVLIHDAARPLLSKSVINEIINSISNNEAILVYSNVKDTIKHFDNGNLKTLDRSKLIAASTPQCAPLEVFRDVYEKASLDHYETTDDISLIEKYRPDVNIKLIKANEENFKVTTPIDYELAKLLVEMK